MRAEARVRPLAERNVGLGMLAEDVETVGIVVALLVSVGCRQHEHHGRPGRDGHAADLRVRRRQPRDVEERRFEPQGLLYGLRNEGAVGAHRLELLGRGQQGEEQVAERAVGRLHARRQQQAEEGEDLLVGQALTVQLRQRQLADEVLARLSSAILQNLRHVLLHLLGGGNRLAQFGEKTEDGGRPTLELEVVLAGEAQDAGDDLRRVGEVEFAYQLGLAVRSKRVDELVGDGTEQLVLPLREHLLAERRRDQGPVATVLRVVHAEHDVLAHDRAHDELDDVGRRERVPVAQHLGDVVVAVDEEHLLSLLVRHEGGFEALHRRGPTSLGQLGVGVAHVAGHGIVEESELVARAGSVAYFAGFCRAVDCHGCPLIPVTEA